MLFPLSQPCWAVEQKEAEGMAHYIWCGQILLACGHGVCVLAALTGQQWRVLQR